MKHLITVFAVIFFFHFHILGQQTFKLNKNCKIDTLYVFLQQNDTVDNKLVNELQIKFDSIVSNFTTQHNKAYKIIIDSVYSYNSIVFVMGKIRYVDCKMRTLTATMDIIGLGLNVLIFPFPPVFPFYLMPATNATVDIIATSDLFRKKERFVINPSGAFINKEKQKEKFKKFFVKEFVKFFNEIDKQYKKNNKL